MDSLGGCGLVEGRGVPERCDILCPHLGTSSAAFDRSWPLFPRRAFWFAVLPTVSARVLCRFPRIHSFLLRSQSAAVLPCDNDDFPVFDCVLLQLFSDGRVADLYPRRSALCSRDIVAASVHSAPTPTPKDFPVPDQSPPSSPGTLTVVVDPPVVPPLTLDDLPRLTVPDCESPAPHGRAETEDGASSSECSSEGAAEEAGEAATEGEGGGQAEVGEERGFAAAVGDEGVEGAEGCEEEEIGGQGHAAELQGSTGMAVAGQGLEGVEGTWQGRAEVDRGFSREPAWEDASGSAVFVREWAGEWHGGVWEGPEGSVVGVSPLEAREEGGAAEEDEEYAQGVEEAQWVMPVGANANVKEEGQDDDTEDDEELEEEEEEEEEEEADALDVDPITRDTPEGSTGDHEDVQPPCPDGHTPGFPGAAPEASAMLQDPLKRPQRDLLKAPSASPRSGCSSPASASPRSRRSKRSPRSPAPSSLGSHPMPDFVRSPRYNAGLAQGPGVMTPRARERALEEFLYHLPPEAAPIATERARRLQAMRSPWTHAEPPVQHDRTTLTGDKLEKHCVRNAREDEHMAQLQERRHRMQQERAARAQRMLQGGVLGGQQRPREQVLGEGGLEWSELQEDEEPSAVPSVCAAAQAPAAHRRVAHGNPLSVLARGGAGGHSAKSVSDATHAPAPIPNRMGDAAEAPGATNPKPGRTRSRPSNRPSPSKAGSPSPARGTRRQRGSVATASVSSGVPGSLCQRSDIDAVVWEDMIGRRLKERLQRLNGVADEELENNFNALRRALGAPASLPPDLLRRVHTPRAHFAAVLARVAVFAPDADRAIAAVRDTVVTLATPLPGSRGPAPDDSCAERRDRRNEARGQCLGSDSEGGLQTRPRARAEVREKRETPWRAGMKLRTRRKRLRKGERTEGVEGAGSDGAAASGTAEGVPRAGDGQCGEGPLDIGERAAEGSGAVAEGPPPTPTAQRATRKVRKGARKLMAVVAFARARGGTPAKGAEEAAKVEGAEAPPPVKNMAQLYIDMMQVVAGLDQKKDRHAGRPTSPGRAGRATSLGRVPSPSHASRATHPSTPSSKQ